MKNKYLIQWIDFDEDGCEIPEVKVKDFTDQELENFCRGLHKLKVTFLQNVSKNYVNEIRNLL